MKRRRVTTHRLSTRAMLQQVRQRLAEQDRQLSAVSNLVHGLERQLLHAQRMARAYERLQELARRAEPILRVMLEERW
jgi:orotidine-5'-phosphate decarboxylase